MTRDPLDHADLAALQREAEDARTPGERLEDLVSFSTGPDRYRYAPGPALRRLTGALARHPNLSPRAWRRLLPEEPRALLANPATPLLLLAAPDLLDKLYPAQLQGLLGLGGGRVSQDEHRAILPAEWYRLLAQRYPRETALVVSRPDFPADLVPVLAARLRDSQEQRSLQALAVHPACPAFLQERLFVPDLPAQEQHHLALSLLDAAKPPPQAARLLLSSSRLVRKAAARALPAACADLQAVGADEDCAWFVPPGPLCDPIAAWLREQARRGWSYAAQLLARHPDTPWQEAAHLAAQYEEEEPMVLWCALQHPGAPVEWARPYATHRLAGIAFAALLHPGLSDAERRALGQPDDDAPPLALVTLDADDMVGFSPTTTPRLLAFLASPGQHLRAGESVAELALEECTLVPSAPVEGYLWPRLPLVGQHVSPGTVLAELRQLPPPRWTQDEDALAPLARRALGAAAAYAGLEIPPRTLLPRPGRAGWWAFSIPSLAEDRSPHLYQSDGVRCSSR